MNNTIEDLHGLLLPWVSEKSAGDIWRDKKTLQNQILIPFKNRHPVNLKRMKALLAMSVWRHSKSRVQEEIDNADFAKVGQCEIIDIRLIFSSQEQIWYETLQIRKTFLILPIPKQQIQNKNKKKLGLNPQTMSRLNELRQSCDHPVDCESSLINWNQRWAMDG